MLAFMDSAPAGAARKDFPRLRSNSSYPLSTHNCAQAELITPVPPINKIFKLLIL